MSVPTSISAWPPSREPAWTDVAVIAAGIFWLVFESPPADSISWLFVALGFVATTVALGPAATSTVGSRIGTWFRAIGVVNRALLIVLFAAGVWLVGGVVDVPTVELRSAVGGLMIAVLVFELLFVLRWRAAEGRDGPEPDGR